MRRRRSPWGRFWPVDSFWHRRDPRVKFILLLLFVWPTVSAHSFLPLLILAAGLFPLWIGARLSFGLMLGTLRSFAWLIALTLLTNLFFARSGWPPRPTVDGASLAGLNALRLALLFVLSSWLTGTTTPLALTGAVGRLLSPLGRLGLPVGDLALVAGLGLRLLPDLMAGGESIRLAQRARGVGTGHTWRERRQGIEAMAASLVGLALRRGDELALAMQARGYPPGRKEPPGAPRALDKWDWLALSAGTVLAALLTLAGRIYL